MKRMMNKSKRADMGFGLIGVGFVFFIIPTVNLLDVMPDFIGYILIYAGLYRLRYMDGYLFKAAKSVIILAALNLAKPLLFLFAVTDNATVSSNNLLTFTFIFAVIELIVGIPFVKNLFDGFLSLGYKYAENGNGNSKKKLMGTFGNIGKRTIPFDKSVMNKNNAIFKRLRRRKCVRYVTFQKRWSVFRNFDLTYKLSLVFFTLHFVFPIIPEMTALIDSSNDLTPAYSTGRQISFWIAAALISFIIGLIISIIWFYVAKKYINSIKNDRIFIKKIEQNYMEKFVNQ